MARIWVLMVLVSVVLLVTPTCCNAARALTDRSTTSGNGKASPVMKNNRRSVPPSPLMRLEIRSLSEAGKHEFEKRLLNWSDQESGDDAVPSSSSTLADNYAAKYSNWVRLQEELVTQDYGDTPAVANPSIPCC